MTGKQWFGLIATILAIVAIVVVYTWATKEKPLGEIVEITNGKIQSVISVSRDGREYYEWLGIPYAAPPVGELRFEPPKPVEPWTGVRNGSKFGSVCAHIDIVFEKGKISGSEDCLFLNVYVPKGAFDRIKANETKPLPVFAFIHGGYFALGSADAFPPDFLMDEMMNYRLNIFGFLSTGDQVVRGNMGLKDQTQALKWIQENIAKFGGDPNEVTIGGTSAGGVSVHFHIVSPLSKGLFKRAISFSGTSLAPWATQIDPEGHVNRVAKLLGCNSTSSQENVKCLKSKDTQTICESLKTTTNPLTRGLDILYLPVPESVIDEDTFLPDLPETLYGLGAVPPVTWISGFATEEGYILMKDLLEDEYNNTATFTNPSFFYEALHLVGPNPALVKEIRDFYRLGNATVEFNPDKNLDQYIGMMHAMGDRYFAVSSHEAVQLHAETGAKTYTYLYNKDGPSFASVVEMLTGTRHPIIDYIVYQTKQFWKHTILGHPKEKLGATHYDDVVMMFRTIENISPSSPYYDFSKKFVKFIVDFTYGKSPEINSVQFPEIRKDDQNFKYVLIDDEPKLVDFPIRDRYNFWKSLKISSFLSEIL